MKDKLPLIKVYYVYVGQEKVDMGFTLEPAQILAKGLMKQGHKDVRIIEKEV